MLSSLRDEVLSLLHPILSRDVDEVKELCLNYAREKLTFENAFGPLCLLASYGIAVIFVYWLQRTKALSIQVKKFLVALPICFFFATPVLVRTYYPPIVSFLTGSTAWILSLRCIQTVLFLPVDYFPSFWRFIVFNFVDYFPPSSLPQDSVFLLVHKYGPKIDWGPRRVGMWLVGASFVELVLFFVLRAVLLPYRDFFLGIDDPGRDALTSYLLLVIFSGFNFLLFYLFGSILTDFGNGSCSFLFGVHLEPFFRFPLFSTSPLNFWNDRWNLYIRGLFHRTIFKPFLHAYYHKHKRHQQREREKKNNKNEQQQQKKSRVEPKGKGSSTSDQKDSEIAIRRGLTSFFFAFGVFVMSGIMHEHVYYCVFGEVTGENMMFFIVHGLACGLQKYAETTPFGRKMAKRIPKWLAWLLTSAFMLATSPLFFAPFIKNRMIL